MFSKSVEEISARVRLLKFNVQSKEEARRKPEKSAITQNCISESSVTRYGEILQLW